MKNYLSSFNDQKSFQVNAITLASKSLRNSKKVKKILELILAFGNYMNSTKKGPCYGFRLQSLDSLPITKSRDKRTNIVHYLSELVQRKYPELANFPSEVRENNSSSVTQIDFKVFFCNQKEKVSKINLIV